MTQLVLTEEQARLVRSATGFIQIADSAGNILAHAQTIAPLEQLDPIDREALELYRRGRNEPKEKGRTSQQVQAMFQALEREWERTGGFDQTYMKTFVGAFGVDKPIPNEPLYAEGCKHGRHRSE